MINTKLTRKAMIIAYNAHLNQYDKAGVPYIYHPIHLAEQMSNEMECCTALLHDVVEDTSVTLDELVKDFPMEVIDALRILTHNKKVPYMKYIEEINKNPLAKTVKIADLMHNNDETRLDEINLKDAERRKKYNLALEELKKDKTNSAREFCSKVKVLANEYNLPFFIVTDGASATNNNNCLAVKNARECHIKWEEVNGFDPYEDWSFPNNYILKNANMDNFNLIKEYKLKSILDYANNLSNKEIIKIKKYVNENLKMQINDYQLIEINSEIIGCLYTRCFEDGLLLDEIYLEEEFRNQKIGSSIIKNILKENNIVYLWVYKNNQVAISLYKKLDFQKIDETETRIFMKFSK